ncbi:CaiB/BaiF CoA transferase family protein [Nocardia brasiliensis]|uniref:CaiB/BaiF CoA transferase family protein n=1 Tax=Nocardia brasiliensis TaxID=37326 RepID=UPI0004A6B35A|nr:CaiB/BaiF CoA-transferase family protein [Nocardia brasiliensis]MBF6548129.1 CoA transferase [Nocardia brasiliensis]
MGPLHGVKVIEIASLAPGPFGAMILADLGAQVLRVDRGGKPGEGIVSPEGPLDRGKHSITLDLKNPDDRDTLLALAEHADVLIEGFRPGVTERLGIGPADLAARNPRLIYGRMTGWGQDGPLARTAGHDIDYIAVSGALGLVGRAGEAPVPPANMLGDYAGGGLLLALGVLGALYERERSGRGQVIDAAMVDGAALFTASMHGLHHLGLWNFPRGENMLDGGAPFYDTYECADGEYLAVGCVEIPFYNQMLAILGIDDPELPFQLDKNGWPQLKEVLGAKFKERTRDEWTELFSGSDACVAPVLSPWEAHEHPHNVARNAFITVNGVLQPAPAPRFDRTPADVPAPLSADPQQVRKLLSGWGVPADDLDRLNT